MKPTDKEKNMKRTAVDAKRAGTIFAEFPEDKRFTVIHDEKHPLYDDRITLPPSDDLALSLARDGQRQPGEIRKNGPNWEFIDGLQRWRAAKLANELIKKGDKRFAFRTGNLLKYEFTVVRPEDEKDAIRKKLAANLRIEDTPVMRARKIARALSWGIPRDEVRGYYGFKSDTSLDNCLRLLDLSPKFQAEVEKRNIPENVARDAAELTHEKQDELLKEMKDKGVLRGAAAAAAVKEKKEGKEVTGKTIGKRLLSRTFLEAYIAELEGNVQYATASLKLIVNHLRMLLGDAEALNELPEAFKPAVKKAKRKASSAK